MLIIYSLFTVLSSSTMFLLIFCLLDLSVSDREVLKSPLYGTSLVAQWLRFCAPSAGGLGLIPGQRIRSHMHATTKSLHATTKEAACCN